jgi:putative ABC transport system permease protein
MLNNNLKLAFRNILRNKLYATINIVGLGIASAFCILVYLYLKNEHSFDRFHKDAGQLYRVEESDIFAKSEDETANKGFFSFLTKAEDQKNIHNTPPILAIDLKRNFAEIENVVRFDGFYKPVVKVGNQNFQEADNIVCADADFFKVFNYPLVKGDAATVLNAHNGVVISERLAIKYFGNADAMGKTIQLPGETKPILVTVNGIMQNFPPNSSMQFDLIFPVESREDYLEKIKNGINSFSQILIIKVKNGTDMARFRQKLDAFGKNYFKPLKAYLEKNDPTTKAADTHIYLRSLADAHYAEGGAWEHYTNLANIYQLITLAVIIMVIACFNYVLLTLTNAISRSQDVGVRKTIGAGRLQIIVQYYTETQLLAFIAVLAGFILAICIMPFFSTLTGAGINLGSFSFFDLAALLIVLALLLGFAAGIYPAYAMSGLKPLNIMRGFSAYRINPILSKSLIVIQFTVCVILVISSLVINKQMRFINKTEMGFDKDQVVLLQNPYDYSDKQHSNSLKEAIYHYADTQPGLDGATGASFYFDVASTNGHSIGGKSVPVDFLNIDYDYFKFNKIPIVKGRDFSRDIASDSAKMELTEEQKAPGGTKIRHNVVINQTLYAMLGQPALDVYNSTIGGVIIGVCKDYHNRDLTQVIQPAYHTVNRGQIMFYWLRIKAGQSIPLEMEKLKAEWNKLTNNMPLNYTFMDEDVAKSYDAYLRWMTTITVSCIIAIILACLGLFGLSGLTTINRTKEIGIRKVLGASLSNIFLLLNRGTIYLAMGAFVIAAPLAWYLVNEWLQNS